MYSSSSSSSTTTTTTTAGYPPHYLAFTTASPPYHIRSSNNHPHHPSKQHPALNHHHLPQPNDQSSNNQLHSVSQLHLPSAGHQHPESIQPYLGSQQPFGNKSFHLMQSQTLPRLGGQPFPRRYFYHQHLCVLARVDWRLVYPGLNDSEVSPLHILTPFTRSGDINLASLIKNIFVTMIFREGTGEPSDLMADGMLSINLLTLDWLILLF